MNTKMGSALPNEKLDRNNFASWEYKMHQYLVGQGYWSYIKGAHVDQPGLKTPEYAIREQAASRVHDHMLSHIRDTKTPQEAWENLKKIFAANTSARKL